MPSYNGNRGTDGNGNVEYQVLTDRLIKSPFDHKEYKIIRLANNVTCTLISNMAKNHQNIHMMQMTDSQPKVEDFNREYPNFNNADVDPVRIERERVSDLGSTADNMSRNKYLGETATAIISFESGQLQDPSEFQGMAHLLEHSVFLGSKTYPEKYGIFRLPNTNISAYTETDGTAYTIQSGLDEFSRGVKYLCDLLINARLADAEVENEVNAVDGEFLIRRNEMLLKIYALLNSFSTAGHPSAKFDCGNSASLLKNGVGEVIRNWKRHTYFGQNMSVVVSAPLPLKNLVQFAIEHFSGFPSAHDNQISASPLPAEQLTQAFGLPHAGPNNFNSMNYISPSSIYTKELLITWSIPPEFWKNFDSKPIDFVGYLINNLPSNKISDLLKCHRYATGAMALPNWLKTTFGSYFTMHIVLTNEGIANLSEVIKLVFSYLKGLREFIPNSAQLFEEKRQAESNHFHYVDSHNTTYEYYYSHNWSVPLKKLNAFNKLTTRFDLNEILKVVNHLANPELANFIVLSKDEFLKNGGVPTNSAGNYYGAVYSSTLIPSDHLLSWKNSSPCPIDPSVNLSISRFGLDCHLTCPEDYKNPSINEAQWVIGMERKIFIRHPVGYGGRLRHIMPFSQYVMGFSSDELVRETPLVSACIWTWTFILNDMLYDLHASNYKNLANFGFGFGYGALFFSLAGISFKLIDIFERVIQTIGNFETLVKEIEFNNAKCSVRSNFEAAMCNGPQFFRDLQNTVLLDQYIPMVEIRNAINELTFSQFTNFTRSFKSRMHIGGEVIGAISEDHRSRMSRAMASLQFDPLRRQKVTHEAKEIPRGEKCVRIKNPDQDDKNSYISNFYFLGNQTWGNGEELEACETILEKMEGDILIKLRAHESLGYVVYSALEDNFSALGIAINLITPTDRFSTDYVDERIDNYLQDFYKREIENKTNQKIESIFTKYLLPEASNLRKISFQMSGSPSDQSKQNKSSKLKDKIERNNKNFSSRCTCASSSKNNNSLNNNSMGDFRFGFPAQNSGAFGGGSVNNTTNGFGENSFGQSSSAFGQGSFNNSNGFGQTSGAFGGTSQNNNGFGVSSFGQTSGTFGGTSQNNNGFGVSSFGQTSGAFGGTSQNNNGFGVSSFGQTSGTFGGTSQNNNGFGVSSFGQNSGAFGSGSVNNTSNGFGENGFGQSSGAFGQGSSNNTNGFGASSFGQNSGAFGGGSMNNNGFGVNNMADQSVQNGSDDGEEYRYDFELPSENIQHATNSYFITRIKEFKRSCPNCPNVNTPEKFMSTSAHEI